MERTAARVVFKQVESSEKSGIGKGGLSLSYIPKNVGMLSRQVGHFMAGERACDLAEE
jgi:hypothetical protein